MTLKVWTLKTHTSNKFPKSSSLLKHDFVMHKKDALRNVITHQNKVDQQVIYLDHILLLSSY